VDERTKGRSCISWLDRELRKESGAVTRGEEGRGKIKGRRWKFGGRREDRKYRQALSDCRGRPARTFRVGEMGGVQERRKVSNLFGPTRGPTVVSFEQITRTLSWYSLKGEKKGKSGNRRGDGKWGATPEEV